LIEGKILDLPRLTGRSGTGKDGAGKTGKTALRKQGVV